MQVVRVPVMADPVRDVVYVAVGRIARSELVKIVSPVVVEDDDLLLGPSSADPRRHRVVRTRHWGVQPSAKLNKELARSGGAPMCVVLPPTLRGLLSFCRVCASGVERRRPVFAMHLRPDLTGSAPQGVDPAEELAFDVADALRRKPPMDRCSELETALAATLWRLWCRRSPVALSRFCASGGALHPRLASLGRYHAGYFPRQDGQKLLLSRFDELLLRQLSREWITPVKLFVNGMRDEAGLHSWLTHVGDLFLPRRLLEWSRHTRGQIVECMERPERPSDMSRWAFRWHTGGEAILDALPSLQAAQPLSIGGAVAYDADRAWVCRSDAKGTPYLSRPGAVAGSEGRA